MEMNEKPGYWAVLPANVRYDKNLRPAARLLYAEISALCNKQGYCTAGNAYFAALYETSIKTVETWIRQLKSGGYIRVEVLRDDSNTVIGREIWITESVFTPPLEKEDTSPRKRVETPLENASHNNTRNNNIPPISPIGEELQKPRRRKAEQPEEPSTVFADYAGADTDLLNTLLTFAVDRETRKKHMTENAKGLLCKRLDKLASNNAEKVELLEHAIVMGWDSVYPMRDKQPPAKKAPAAAISQRKESREL